MMPKQCSYQSVPEIPLVEHETSGPSELNDLTTICRICGVLYAIIIVCGMTAEVGVRSQLIDFASPEATADSISAAPDLFRLGMMADVTMACADAGVAVLLGWILIKAGATPLLAVVQSVFRFLQTGTIAVNLLNSFMATILLDSTMKFSEVIEETTLAREDLAFTFLLLQKYGYLLALIFFGISLVILGSVVLKDGVFPKIFGGLLLLAGIGYVTDSCLYFINSGYFGEWTNVLMMPALFGEFGFAGWLLVGVPSPNPKE